jgi:Lsr2
MAQKMQVVFTDDTDGGPADETVKFAIDGTAFEIDLSAAHADELRLALRPYIAVARKVSGSTRRASRSRPAGPSPSDVRAWAKAEGLKVSDRGRVPDGLIVKFRAAGQ